MQHSDQILTCLIMFNKVCIHLWVSERHSQNEKSRPSEESSRTALVCTICGNGGVAVGWGAACKHVPWPLRCISDLAHSRREKIKTYSIFQHGIV